MRGGGEGAGQTDPGCLRIPVNTRFGVLPGEGALAVTRLTPGPCAGLRAVL